MERSMRHMSAGNAAPGKQEEKEKEVAVAEEDQAEKSGSESGNSLLHGRLLAHRLYNKVTKW